MKKLYAFVFTLLFLNFFASAQSTTVVINEVYGGGNNSGALYRNDFVELYNNSTNDISIAGWQVSYFSASGGSGGTVTLANTATIKAKGYYLIQLAGGTTNGQPLPTPDATGSISMSATSGRVDLLNASSVLIDRVGFGTATTFEGAAAPAPSNTTSIQRTPIGTDSNNNAEDFKTGSPSPVSGTADVTAPTVASTYPAYNSNGIALRFTATITFNEPIQKGTSGSITITDNSTNTVIKTYDITTAEVTVSNATASFSVSGLNANTSYTIQVAAGSFKDQANNNFGGISGNTWTFTTGSAIYAANFNACSSALSDGLTQYSVTGAITWSCTTFGRDASNPSASTASGVQINGFSGGTNVPNVDWLILPALNLTGTTFPLLSFWSRTAFNGQPLQVKVSTNYNGTGDPNAATWTDLNGKFPAQGSDVWTLSNNINLSNFKQSSVYIAFVYQSSDEEGARWTLDDITVDNSATPPPSSITVSTSDIQFSYTAAGSNSIKTFALTGNDITTDVTLTTSSPFLLSKDGATFSSSITYTLAEANNTPKTVYVQFVPAQNNKNSTGTVSIQTSGLTSIINLKGTSVDPAGTLEVVNWNIEWFGSMANGPTNEAQQEQNVKTILQNINADVYALMEVVDETKLANVVSQMPGYTYVISNFGSHTNPNSPTPSPLADAQKLAFVYKTSVLSNVSDTALLSQGINSAADISNPAYNYFSSGRFPYMLSGDVTLNGVTKNVKFILLHAKANTSPTATSYDRRKRGADTLNYTLNLNYPNDNIILLGDFNDDLDSTITANTSPKLSSYKIFTDDPNFSAISLPLSLAGKKSTVSYNDVIDHVMVSNECRHFYMNNTASILTDVSSLVSNYANSTSDHYPVFSRFAFDPAILPVKLVSFTAYKEGAVVKLAWETSQEVSTKEFRVERSRNGRSFETIGTVAAKGNTTNSSRYTLLDTKPEKGNNYYRLKVMSNEGKSELSHVIRMNLLQDFSWLLSPNPASSKLLVNVGGFSGPLVLQLIDLSGKVVKTKQLVNASTPVSLEGMGKGLYLVRLTGNGAVYTDKLVIE